MQQQISDSNNEWWDNVGGESRSQTGSLVSESETSEVVNLLSSMVSRLDILRSEIASRRQFQENNQERSPARPDISDSVNVNTESPQLANQDTNQEDNHTETEVNDNEHIAANEDTVNQENTNSQSTTVPPPESFNPPLKDISHLVTIGCKLDSRSSYLRWSLLIEMALRHNHLYHIIDPDETTPEEPSEVWKRQDNFVELLLLSTVSEKWESFVIYSRNAREAWILLKGAFYIEDAIIMRENYKEIFSKTFNARKDDVVEYLAQIQCRFQTLKFLGYETPEDSQVALVVANLPTKFYQEVTKKLDIDSNLTYGKLQKVMVSIQLRFYTERKSKLEEARQLRRAARQEQHGSRNNNNNNTLSALTPTRDPKLTRRQLQRSRKSFRKMIRNRKGARARETEASNAHQQQQSQSHTSAAQPPENFDNSTTTQRQRQTPRQRRRPRQRPRQRTRPTTDHHPR